MDPLGRVRHVTITNPAKRNALDDPARRRLLADVEDAIADPSCDVIVLTGADGSFCAGGDLPSMPTDPALIRQRLGEMQTIVRLIIAGPKPVVAAVEGPAFGSGLALAAACDVVVAARDARFGCVFGTMGLIADSGLLWTLPQRIGAARARRMAVTNAVLDAAEAAEIGLVDELCDPGTAVSVAGSVAASLVAQHSGAVGATKALLAAAPSTLDELLEREMDVQIARFATSEFTDRRDAFVSRRRPADPGR
jgi:2-(1,2-epoxy-1,2-dihydrophenyl)acetyl-CoA isomerase